MGAPHTGKTRKLTLGAFSGLGRVHVDIESFFTFSFWLAEELEDLVRSASKRLPPVARRRTRLFPRSPRE